MSVRLRPGELGSDADPPRSKHPRIPAAVSRDLTHQLAEVIIELDRAGAPADQNLPNRVRQLARAHRAEIDRLHAIAPPPAEGDATPWLDVLRACYAESRRARERFGALEKLLAGVIDRAENPAAPPAAQPITIGVDKETK